MKNYDLSWWNEHHTEEELEKVFKEFIDPFDIEAYEWLYESN